MLEGRIKTTNTRKIFLKIKNDGRKVKKKSFQKHLIKKCDICDSDDNNNKSSPSRPINESWYSQQKLSFVVEHFIHRPAWIRVDDNETNSSHSTIKEAARVVAMPIRESRKPHSCAPELAIAAADYWLELLKVLSSTWSGFKQRAGARLLSPPHTVRKCLSQSPASF